jgi:hypothetical protein
MFPVARAVIVGSNPTGGIFFIALFVLSYVDKGIAMADRPSKEPDQVSVRFIILNYN